MRRLTARHGGLGPWCRARCTTVFGQHSTTDPMRSPTCRPGNGPDAPGPGSHRPHDRRGRRHVLWFAGVPASNGKPLRRRGRVRRGGRSRSATTTRWRRRSPIQTSLSCGNDSLDSADDRPPPASMEFSGGAAPAAPPGRWGRQDPRHWQRPNRRVATPRPLRRVAVGNRTPRPRTGRDSLPSSGSSHPAVRRAPRMPSGQRALVLGVARHAVSARRALVRSRSN